MRLAVDASSTVELVISVDVDDNHSIKAASSVPGATVVIQNVLPGNCTRGWNAAAQKSTGKVLLAISDDSEPMYHWNVALFNVMPEGWMDDPWVIHVNDGLSKLCTLPVMTRAWYEARGYLYHPDYTSMFNDEELTEHATLLGQLHDAPKLLFRHAHWINNLRPRDKIDDIHSSTDRFNTNKALFLKRKAAGFPKITPA